MQAKPGFVARASRAPLTVLTLCLAPLAGAASLTWDTATGDGAAITAAGGSWDTSTVTWNNAGADVAWSQTSATANTNAAIFAGADGDEGAYPISVTTGIATQTLTFSSTGYALSADAARTITLTSNTLSVASGKSATVGPNVTASFSAVGSQSSITGGGTLKIAGTGATVTKPSNVFNIIGGTTVEVGTSGLLTTSSQIVIGTNSGNGTVVVDGGTVSSTTTTANHNLILANASGANTISGTLTINSGTVTHPAVSGGLRFGSTTALTASNTATGTLNLNGGQFTVARLYEASTDPLIISNVNFNGGKLIVRAGATNAANFMAGLDHAYVMDNGAIIDTNGMATTIAQTLEHGGGAATDGGLTKSGANALTLSSANSYTGITAVNVGGLVASNNGALGTTDSHTTVASGAALGFSGSISYSNGERIVGSGVGNTSAISGTFAAVQRGFVQSVNGSNSFAGNIEISATGISRIGTQDGASLTLTGSIARGSGVSGVSVLFRTGTSGDFVTLSNSGNNWDLDTVIFTGATSGAGGVRLGTDNALPVASSIVAGGNSTGSGTTVDLNGFDQTLAGIVNSNGALHITNSNSLTPSTLTLDTATADRSNFSIVGLTTIEDGAGQVALLKTGAFTQTLVGTHTYTGPTTVSAGTLLANGTLVDTDVTVNAGAFGGTGTVGGTLDLAGGSFHVVDLTNPLDLTGTISLYAGFGVDDLTGLNWGSVEDGRYTLINGALGSGVFDNLAHTSLATAYDLGGGRSAYFQNGSLDLVVVPEPAAATLLGLLGVLGLCRRRRN